MEIIECFCSMHNFISKTLSSMPLQLKMQKTHATFSLTLIIKVSKLNI